ncbi:hypothetical protein FRX31_034996 [Thalictrum thalictroides]|uniref:Zinc knuckle (CCHC-type) family protein n=1 Tax=Thalictrum thalictroides TaxID=46969 RepID=A0A7J6US99_THATH|nr:hypothetical protein FRX31_034996 [Thalictrum thalictroides]
MDKATENKTSLSFARVCIDVDATKDLFYSHELKLGSKSIKIEFEYPWKPSICTVCKIFGHNTSKCSPQPIKKTENKQGDWQMQGRKWVRKQYNRVNDTPKNLEIVIQKAPVVNVQADKALVKTNTNRFAALELLQTEDQQGEPSKSQAEVVEEIHREEPVIVKESDENVNKNDGIYDSDGSVSSDEEGENDIDETTHIEDGVADHIKQKKKIDNEPSTNSRGTEGSQLRNQTRNAAKASATKEIPSQVKGNGRDIKQKGR